MATKQNAMGGRRPSGLRLDARLISLVLVAAGLLVSGYLSYVKATGVPMACTGEMFNCGTVQNSDYSELFGVPIAYLGFMTYVVIGGLILLQDRWAFLRENGIVLLFGVVLFAWLYSMYLIYVQGVILQAWCQWCLTHEAIITVLFGATIWRLNRFLADEEAESV
ncbi:MAG: vitamin K epoxide reductase family protein [Anaerolineaceae bacterium]|nr:MAG: vitamin K epoxide reductase family protein [Anaerolineaceae bacterium]